MNFGLSDEQQLLRAEVRKFLDQNCPMEEVRKLADSPEGFSRSMWERMGELGWIGLAFPEAQGGLGLSWLDLAVVLEETGRSLFPSPFVATLLAAKAIEKDGSEAQRERWLPGLADGSLIGSFAFLERGDSLSPSGIGLAARPDGDAVVLRGEKLFVLDAGVADLFAVAFRSGPRPEDVSLAVVPRGASGLRVDRLETMDPTRRQGRVIFDDVTVPAEALLGRPGAAWPTLSHLLDCGAVAVTAEMIGAASAALELTVRYAQQRTQFGAPIGRFQGVKHPLAEMYVNVESFRSLLYYAAWTLDERPDEAPLAVSRAKAYASDAFPRIGIDAVGLHGAIGYTWEYDVQLFLKRAKWSRPAFGDAAYHGERIATLGGL